MRAAIYARVSSAAQRDAHTVESQLHVLRPFVAAQGWTLTETYVDDGHSAKTGKLELRDAFARMMRDAASGAFDIVVVFDVSRLTRTESIDERAQILGPLQRLGIRIATPTGGILDLRSFLGEFFVTIHALMNAEDNRQKSERVKSGKLRAIAAGRKPAGRPPYGLRFDRSSPTWTIDDARAEVVREIFRRVIAGDSCETIAVDLDERAVPPPERGSWTRRKVWGIARSRHVLGEWVADKAQRLTVAIPAIVDVATWSAAQEMLIAHGKRGLVKTKHVYLLEGLAVCGECGSPMALRSAYNVKATARRPARVSPAAYVCRARKDARRGEQRCTAAIAPVVETDARVWAQVELELASEDLADAVRRRIDQRSANRRDWQADIATHRAHLDRLVKVETALLARFRRGSVSAVALDAELAALERERAAVQRQLDAARAGAGSDAEPVRDAEQWVDTLRALAASVAPEARQRVVRSLVDRGGAVFRGTDVILTLTLDDAPASSGGGVALARGSTRSAESRELSESRLRIRVLA
jgi:site-specific DNA recombinase